jgi:SOS-response transcriptional repressor LexA
MPEKTTGFASPAQGYEEDGIDLNRLLIRNPPATIYVRLDSSDMEALGLVRDTLLAIDRSITPTANALVMLRHEGKFLCRLLIMKGVKQLLQTEGKLECLILSVIMNQAVKRNIRCFHPILCSN